MKQIIKITILGLIANLALAKEQPQVFKQNQIPWQHDDASNPDSAAIALLEGGFDQKKPLTFRLKLPKDYVVKRHTHPGVEHVTVLSGKLTLTISNKTYQLSAGDFALIPANTEHQARITENTVIQIHSLGPWRRVLVEAEN